MTQNLITAQRCDRTPLPEWRDRNARDGSCSRTRVPAVRATRTIRPAHKRWLLCGTGLCFLLGLVASCSVCGANRDAARKVQTGIAKHSAGEFADAEKAFAEAANMLPNDPRVAYDQACALAAQGKHEEAEKLFRTARLAHDSGIVAASDYNLGCLAAATAKAKLGEKPEEATPEMRKEGLELIRQAVGHYRDCLATAPDHDNARHNLEVLRLWMKHIEEVWRQRDREKRRQEMNLLQFLEAIQADQTMLRNTSRALVDADDSPRRRQAGTMASHAQRELAEEIPFLQEKIRGTLLSSGSSAQSAGAGNPPAVPPQVDPQLARAVDSLVETASQTRAEMSRAVTDLATNLPQNAVSAQTKALDKLDELYRAVAPFEHVLQRSIATEERLTDDTRLLVDASTSPPSAAIPTSPSPPPASRTLRGGPADIDSHVDSKERAREQRMVGNWVETLAPKAKQQLEALKAAPPPPATPATAPNNPAPNNPAPNNNGNQGAVPTQPADDAATRAQLAAAYEKAIELGPQAHTAASDAVPQLEEKQWAGALSSQEEALRLLKEIAEAMPKQPPQDKQDQDKQDQDKQKQEDKQGQEKQEQDSSDSQQQQPKDEQKDKNEEGKDESKKQPNTQQKLSPQNAEAMLRQVRQREREYKELQKKMRGVIVGGVPVDKDW